MSVSKKNDISSIGHLCTGCEACYNICPKQCIHERVGELGHLYPEIDREKCIQCGLCFQICPAVQTPDFHYPLKAYAAWSKDETDYRTSTSGGASSVFSQAIIREGGIVYGCMADGVNVRHTRITSLKELSRIKSSKYVQSQIGDCYKLVREDLKNGKKVLFIGTPCQCFGLKSFLRKEYEQLITIDLICHGVPSRSLLEQHAEKKLHCPIGQIKTIRFREGTECILTIDNGSNKYTSNLWEQRHEDAYYNAFMDGYSYRESCYHCKFAHIERCTDITIGDFWGLGEKVPFTTPHPFGVSVLLPCTSKGLHFISDLDHFLFLYDREIKEAEKGNDQLRTPKRKTMRARIFRHLFRYFSLEGSYRLVTIDYFIKKQIKKVYAIFR